MPVLQFSVPYLHQSEFLIDPQRPYVVGIAKIISHAFRDFFQQCPPYKADLETAIAPKS